MGYDLALSSCWEITLVDHVGSCALLLSLLGLRAKAFGANSFVLHMETILYRLCTFLY